MPYDSEPRFRVLHALRIKGFAKVDVLADLSAVDPDDVEQQLADFQAEELALFREARALWQLTPKGRALHAKAKQIADTMEHELLSHFSGGERAMLFELLQKVSAQRRP